MAIYLWGHFGKYKSWSVAEFEVEAKGTELCIIIEWEDIWVLEKIREEKNRNGEEKWLQISGQKDLEHTEIFHFKLFAFLFCNRNHSIVSKYFDIA